MRSLLSILTHSAPNPRLRVQNFQSVTGTSERLSSFCIEAHFITNNDHHKQSQVGFYGPTAPPGPNAPSSRICDQNPRNDADGNISGSAHLCRRLPLCCTLRSAAGCRNGKFQNVSLPYATSTAAACYDQWEVAEMANFKMYLPR